MNTRRNLLSVRPGMTALVAMALLLLMVFVLVLQYVRVTAQKSDAQITPAVRFAAFNASPDRHTVSKFESLTIAPGGRFLYTATENALFQDGPAASVDDQSLSRIIKYDLVTGQPVQEVVYIEVYTRS